MPPELEKMQKFIQFMSRSVPHEDERAYYRALDRFIDTFEPSDLAEAHRCHSQIKDTDEESYRAFGITRQLYDVMPDIVIKQTFISYFRVG